MAGLFHFIFGKCVDEAPDYVDSQALLREFIWFRHISKLESITVNIKQHVFVLSFSKPDRV